MARLIAPSVLAAQAMYSRRWNAKMARKNSETLVIRSRRVDSNKGYERNNIVPCCYKCNTLKWNSKYGDFIIHINKIYKWNKFQKR